MRRDPFVHHTFARKKNAYGRAFISNLIELAPFQEINRL